MPTLFEIQTVTRQFFRVESELSVLKAMVRDLLTPPVDPMQTAPNAPLTVDRQPPQHFDGKHWRPGPTPDPTRTIKEKVERLVANRQEIAQEIVRLRALLPNPDTENNVEGLDVPPGQG